MQDTFKYNGTVKLTAFRDYIAWYSSLDYKASMEQKELCRERVKDLLPPSHIRAENGTPEQRAAHKLYETVQDFFGVRYWCSYDSMDQKYAPIKAKSMQLMNSLLQFAEGFEQEVKVAIWLDEYALIYIGNAEKGIPVVNPSKYMEYVPEKDYSDLTPSQMQMALDGNTELSVGRLVPDGAEHTLTVKMAQRELDAYEEELKAHRERIEKTSKCESEELIKLKTKIERLQQKMWAKKAELMEELEEKLLQMEEVKFKLEGQIYLLDSQIYSILCYAGETVNFAKIRSGAKAKDTEPIVVHQKLNFLDEVLGRLASIYYIDWHEIDMFETFLAHHPLALDAFAPNERCVTLCRLSRTNRKLGMGADRYGNYNNIMEHYEYFHGSTVGIIIRNGENLWLGWCDEDRIDIDDDLIIDRTVTNVEPAELPEFRFKSDKKKYFERQRAERKKVLDGFVSRSFVYSILQGVVDRTDMLPLPTGVKLGQEQSEYVVYAVADKWLLDRRFGTLEDIVKAANASVHEGDMILTTQYLVPEREYGMSGRNYDPRWQNTRGRGEKNRTHDCKVEDCTIYPVNLVEFDPNYFEAQYMENGIRYKAAPSWGNKTTREGLIKYMEEYHKEITEYDIVEFEGDRHVFVSIQKQGMNYNTWERTTARSNFELNPDEYINLNNISSIHLEYAITNRSVAEHFKIAGKVADYAFVIRYLKTAMEHVREREQAEKALIDAIDASVCVDPEWVMDILKFKAEKNVRNFNETWAKRFVNWIKTRDN